jgi:hypothetical protein
MAGIARHSVDGRLEEAVGDPFGFADHLPH